MTSEEDKYTIIDKFQKAMDYEQVLNMQIARISQYMSSKDIELYEESVDTLILMLPEELRHDALAYKKENNINYLLSTEGKKKYDDLWVFVNKLLENHNLIFRTSFTKTYH